MPYLVSQPQLSSIFYFYLLLDQQMIAHIWAVSSWVERVRLLRPASGFHTQKYSCSSGQRPCLLANFERFVASSEPCYLMFYQVILERRLQKETLISFLSTLVNSLKMPSAVFLSLDVCEVLSTFVSERVRPIRPRCFRVSQISMPAVSTRVTQCSMFLFGQFRSSVFLELLSV